MIFYFINSFTKFWISNWAKLQTFQFVVFVSFVSSFLHFVFSIFPPIGYTFVGMEVGYLTHMHIFFPLKNLISVSCGLENFMTVADLQGLWLPAYTLCLVHPCAMPQACYG